MSCCQGLDQREEPRLLPQVGDDASLKFRQTVLRTRPSRHVIHPPDWDRSWLVSSPRNLYFLRAATMQPQPSHSSGFNHPRAFQLAGLLGKDLEQDAGFEHAAELVRVGAQGADQVGFQRTCRILRPTISRTTIPTEIIIARAASQSTTEGLFFSAAFVSSASASSVDQSGQTSEALSVGAAISWRGLKLSAARRRVRPFSRFASVMTNDPKTIAIRRAVAHKNSIWNVAGKYKKPVRIESDPSRPSLLGVAATAGIAE